MTRKTDTQDDTTLSQSLTGQDGQTDDIAPLELGELNDAEMDTVHGAVLSGYLKMPDIDSENRLSGHRDTSLKIQTFDSNSRLATGYLKIGDIKGE